MEVHAILSPICDTVLFQWVLISAMNRHSLWPKKSSKKLYVMQLTRLFFTFRHFSNYYPALFPDGFDIDDWLLDFTGNILVYQSSYEKNYHFTALVDIKFWLSPCSYSIITSLSFTYSLFFFFVIIFRLFSVIVTYIFHPFLGLFSREILSEDSPKQLSQSHYF